MTDTWYFVEMQRRTSILPIRDLQRMYSIQRGRCGICGRSFALSALVPDHNHVTGRFRGLLCGRCNVIEGWLANLMDEVGYDVTERFRRWTEEDGYPDLDAELGESLYLDSRDVLGLRRPRRYTRTETITD